MCLAALVDTSVACAQLAVEASDGMGCSAGSAADAGGQPLLEQTVSVMQLCVCEMSPRSVWLWPKKLSTFFISIDIDNYYDKCNFYLF